MKNARNLAHDSLYNIKHRGAYSNIEVNRTLRECELKPVDKGFYTELVYGTLENVIYLDHIVQKFSKISVGKLSHSILIILEMGLYQIIEMDSVSDFAAVNESVSLTNVIDQKSSGFVNAILRNVLRDETAFDVLDKSKEETLRIKYSVSDYIFSRLVEYNGLEGTKDILESFGEKPEIYLRVNLNRVSREKLQELLQKSGVEASIVENSKVALKVKGLKSIETNEYYLKGYYTVQDLSSMICVEVLDPTSEDKVLDMCACPGGKTTYIGEIMKGEGVIHAMDISEPKLKLASRSCKRLGIKNVQFAINDGTRHRTALDNKYTKVLVDAPCSGFGIMRRKPEIRYKKKADVVELPEIQKQILTNAAAYVQDGGTLIYSTCTIEPRENQNIVQMFLEDNPNFQLENISHPLIKSENGEYGLQLLPNIDGYDGFFLAKLRKTKGE